MEVKTSDQIIDQILAEDTSISDISHYGILGMKWGIRKQPDGSRVRTGSSTDQSSGYEPQNPGIGEGGEPPKIGSGTPQQQKREAQGLSDEELRSRLNRLNMEQQYVKLTSKKTTGQKGQQLVKDILSEAGKNIAKEQVKNYGNKAVDRAIKDAIGKTKKN